MIFFSLLEALPTLGDFSHLIDHFSINLLNKVESALHSPLRAHVFKFYCSETRKSIQCFRKVLPLVTT